MGKCTKERFLDDVQGHQMKILKDVEVYRHIQFARPGAYDYHFSITTWPMHLAITGDMGDYVFRRHEDMFRLFRRDKLEINPDYWHQKLVADSRFEPAMKFEKELLEEAVKGEFRRACREGDIPIKKRRYEWDAMQIVMDARTPEEAYEYAWGSPLFDDGLGDVDLMDYSYHFIWCLYAIVWGIQRYDEA